jgi:hypothetical protein
VKADGNWQNFRENSSEQAVDLSIPSNVENGLDAERKQARAIYKEIEGCACINDMPSRRQRS